jgi:hypothetical protein
MMRNAGSIIVVLLLTSCLLHAQSASPDKKPTQEEQEQQRKELAAKGKKLLEEAVGEAQSLRAVKNRIRAQIEIGGLLWPQDAARAHAVLSDAANTLRDLVGQGGQSDPRNSNEFYSLRTLRQTFIQAVGPLDPELALSFIQSTQQPSTSSGMGGYPTSVSESELEISLASQIAQTNPQKALEIGESVLAQWGVTQPTTSLFFQLTGKNPALASSFLNALMTSLRNNGSSNPSAGSAILNLLQAGIFSKTAAQQAPPGTNAKPPIITDQVMQTLIQLLSASLAPSASDDQWTFNTRNNTLSMLQSLAPNLAKYGLLTDSLQNQLAAYEQTMSPQQNQWQVFNQMMSKNPSVDALLQAAANAPPNMQYNYYSQAVNKAIQQDDVGRATQIIQDDIQDPNQRNNMLRNVDNQVLWRTINAGKFEEAQQKILGFPTVQDRINGLIQLSSALAQKGDKPGAIQLLDLARGMVRGPIDRSTTLSMTTQLALAYSNVAPERAGDLQSALIDTLNSLVGPAALLDPFERETYPAFDSGELLLVSGGFLSNLSNSIIQSLSSIAKTGFDQAKTMSDRIQPLEVRVQAHISLARQALSPEKQLTQQTVFSSGMMFTSSPIVFR